jgi:hypothetical protein
MRDGRHILAAGLAAPATDSASTNEIDLASATHQIDQSVKKMHLNISIATDFAGGTSCVSALQDSADGITYADAFIKSADLAQATLVAGYLVLRVPLPAKLRRWIQVWADETGAFSGGTWNAWVDVD